MNRAQPGRYCRSSRRLPGFTLIEVLVVLAIIAGIAAFSLPGSTGRGRSQSLQSAQAAVANVLSLARVRAIASGQSMRVLLHIDPTSTLEPQRYLRYLVVQLHASAGWETVTESYLPAGIYVVPGSFSTLPAGLFAPATSGGWVRSDGVSLRSTALRASMITSEAINASAVEQWVTISFAAFGSTAQAGDIVLALGGPRSPGSYGAGESPIQLNNPEAVRGVTVSSYGVTALIENRRSF